MNTVPDRPTNDTATVPDGSTTEFPTIPPKSMQVSAALPGLAVPGVPGYRSTPYARAHEDPKQQTGTNPALHGRIVDTDGHAWPTTGATCISCATPLIQTHPAQLTHPCCEVPR